ncbi:hybrid sensor histidine kinase/response regulator [Lacipirellula parvula]|uniref:histidine kinase n=1 Tax=Lacipirellula parvula TaxID=2650471 RepID=A0A5K7XBJ0_9BACT|nr:hybrid sensor histidine kinase/response regulator [Lacipirellula parvula]BBO33312.1 two-component transcriptional response regulator [Lacipirellula parvula]
MIDGSLPKAKILVVDDDPSKVMAIEAVLHSLDQTIVSATSGEEALRRLLKEDFAVILLDVNMPGVDGFETAEYIRQRRQSEHTPIIFLTAYADDAFEHRGYALGAVDYLLMPATPEMLRAKVGVFVDLFHKREQVKLQADERVLLAQEQAARVEAERASIAKSQFLTNISHELRTPMTAIIGMTDLSLMEPLAANVREYLGAVRTNAHLLLELLNEILDLSKLESGTLTLESAPLQLRRILSELKQTFGHRADQKGLELQVIADPAVPNHLIGDSLRLRQVIFNLLTNAIKFTDHGRVTLDVRVESSCDREAWIRFAVSDTGIGISQADQERIFSPFTQVDASTKRRRDGAGLGLAISADLIRAMGGRRSVRSELGKGSKFSFVVPLLIERNKLDEIPASAPSLELLGTEALAPSGARPSIKILLAEDTPTNQLLVRHALGKRGHQVVVAGDGRTAVDLARRGTYDLILMDLQMPDMDGFEATAAIRALPGDQPPIIALTAHTMMGDRERCLAAGMQNYLSKPIDLRELIFTVEATVSEAWECSPRKPIS